MNIQPTQQKSKWLRFFQIFVIIFLLFSFLFVFMLTKQANEPSSFQLDQHGQKIGSGATEFKIYQNQVYVSVPSNGEYLIAEADKNSIRTLAEGDYSARQIAVDQKQVFCGNLILKGLNPAKVYSLGDGYLSDGQTTWYCSPSTERNTELNPVQEIWQIILYNFGLGKKPQTYLYTFYQLKNGAKPYQLIESNVVSNGENTYAKGKLIDGAKGGQLRYINSFSDDLSDMRPSHRYSADGLNVYYQDQRVPVKDHAQLLSFDFDGGLDSEFLYAPLEQLFYYHTQPFPKQHAPYQILNRDSKHANDPLFLSQDGIWFYNRTKEEPVRAGDNPFKSKFIQLAPDVYHNGQDTYYLGIYDHVVRSGRGSKTCYRSTVLYRLANTPLKKWQKIGDVRYGGMWSSGTVWKNGQHYYYFDEFGQGQLINQAVYLIPSQKALQTILNPSQSTDDIRAYKRNGMIVQLDSEEAVQAKYAERFCLSNLWN